MFFSRDQQRAFRTALGQRKVDNQASFGGALSPLTDKRVMQIALRLEF
jgi:hypothetical protein